MRKPVSFLFHKSKNLFFLLFLVTASCVISQAQSLSIEGNITDKTNKPMLAATVRVLNSDSVFIKGSTTDETCFFKIDNLKPGFIIIKISYIGFNDLYFNKQITDKPLIMGTLILLEKSASLNEATVTGQTKMAEQKGDTTQYNAGAFKTNPDATAEDLVTKLPGVTSEDGKL